MLPTSPPPPMMLTFMADISSCGLHGWMARDRLSTPPASAQVEEPFVTFAFGRRVRLRLRSLPSARAGVARRRAAGVA